MSWSFVCCSLRSSDDGGGCGAIVGWHGLLACAGGGWEVTSYVIRLHAFPPASSRRRGGKGNLEFNAQLWSTPYAIPAQLPTSAGKYHTPFPQVAHETLSIPHAIPRYLYNPPPACSAFCKRKKEKNSSSSS